MYATQRGSASHADAQPPTSSSRGSLSDSGSDSAILWSTSRWIVLHVHGAPTVGVPTGGGRKGGGGGGVGGDGRYHGAREGAVAASN